MLGPIWASICEGVVESCVILAEMSMKIVNFDYFKKDKTTKCENVCHRTPITVSTLVVYIRFLIKY